MPVGFIVEYRGRRWEKVMMGAADQEWRVWEISERGYRRSATGNWVPMVN